MADQSALIRHITSNPETLIQTDYVRELWMIPERMVGEYVGENGQDIRFTITTESPLYRGKLFVYDRFFYSIDQFERIDDRHGETKVFSVIGRKTYIAYDPNENAPLCTPQDPMILEPGMITNYLLSDKTKTTVGRYVANYLFLAYPFGDTIPYLNEEFTTSKLEKLVSDPLLKKRVSVQATKDRYINTMNLFGQSNEMICPNISEKTITIPQHIHDLREKLVAENRAALEAGDASVMSDIEQKLITEYKKYLQGDPSLHFLLKKKYFNVTLKKLFLTQGMTEVFGSPGKFVFVDNPMGSGWKVKDLPAIFNEVRSGSYSRAVETANGGVIAKLILRVLQDTRIAVDDCGTLRGEKVLGSPRTLKDFEWNYVVNQDGSTTMINDETIPKYVGKNITIRTPGYCQATQGFCAKCFGYLFEQLGQKAFAPVANDFARTQTTNSLKSMHGKSHSVVDVSDINRYLVVT